MLSHVHTVTVMLEVHTSSCDLVDVSPLDCLHSRQFLNRFVREHQQRLSAPLQSRYWSTPPESEPKTNVEGCIVDPW